MKLGFITITPRSSSNQWSGETGSPRPKKFRVHKSAGKILGLVFWDKGGGTPHKKPAKGRTINAEYFVSVERSEALKQKLRGNLSCSVFFLQDNPPALTAHETLRKIRDFRFELVDRPPYSPDPTPSDYQLLPKRKKHLEGTKFPSDPEEVAATEVRLEAQRSEFVFQGLEKGEGPL